MGKAKILGKIINCMPEKIAIALSKKVMRNYINKYASIEVDGFENIKSLKNPIIFVCNHLSNADGLVLNEVLKEKDPTFVAGIKLTNDPFTNIGMKVVKTIKIKPNSADKEAITLAIKTLKDGENLMIFPEGTRSRTGAMIKGKKGIILIARMSKATIVPIGMSGTEKLLPINVDGQMSKERFHHSNIDIKIGQPINLPQKYEGEDRHEYDDRCLDYIMQEIAVLLPKEYRGEYN